MATIDEPNIPQMEAIRGRGDTITGMISGFIHAGLELCELVILAAKTNRMAGRSPNLTPSTKICEITRQFPKVFEQYLCQWTGMCHSKNSSEEN